MKKIFLLALFILPISVSADMPSFPMAFWGTVSVNNNPAPIGTVVKAYYGSSLAGTATIAESGIYGYTEPTKQKLVVGEGSGQIRFTVQSASFGNGSETVGNSAVSYSGFVSGSVVQKNLNFTLSDNQIAPNASGSVVATVATPKIMIVDPTQAVTVTVNDETANPTIDVSSFISGGAGTLPAIAIASNNTNAALAIPASTVVTSSDASWDGVIMAPTATTVALPNTAGQTKTLGRAIELGSSGAKLSFNKAVRLSLVGQAGKRAGYIGAGVPFTEITDVCELDTQASGNALEADGECKLDVGSDLVIWTKHFTSFATYTQTAVSSGGGGGSSGGGGGGGGMVTSQTHIADATGDGKVDILDFNSLLIQWNRTGSGLTADFDKSGKVDILDFNMLLINWSK